MDVIRTHPFPPLVRWLLFPTLASVTGALAALAAATLTSENDIVVVAGMMAPMSAAGALAFALPGLPWIGAAAAPFFGVALFCSGFAAYNGLTGGPYDSAGWVLEKLLTAEAEWLPVVGGISFALCVAHRLRLKVGGGWKGAAVYLAAGVGISVVAGTVLSGSEARTLVWVGVLTGSLHVLPMELALRLSRKEA